MKKQIVVLSLIFITLVSCSKWRVSTLKPKKIAFIENGREDGKVAVQIGDSALSELSFGIGVFDDRICSADNVLKRVQIYDSEGKP